MKKQGRAAPYAPPADVEAEEWVIGSALIDPGGYYTVSYLSPDDFSHWRTKAVWEAIGRLVRQHAAIDMGTISKELEKAKTAVEPDYLTGLIGCVPTAMHIGHYARVVADLGMRRRLMQAGAKIIQVAYEQDDAEAACRQSWELLQRLRANGSGREVLEHRQTTEVLFEHQVAIQKALEEPSRGLIDTPWPQVNETLGRLEPGQVVTVAAVTSGGKTCLVEQILEHNAQQGAQVAYFHLEYSSEYMLQRRASRLSGISFPRVRMGYNGDEIQETMDKISAWLGQEHFIHCAGWDAGRIASKIIELRARGMCDLAAIDYLQLVRLTRRSGDNKASAIGEALGTIKEALEMAGVPGIITSQLSREHERGVGKRRQPGLSDLRESGDIEQRSNLVMFLWPRNKYEYDYGGADVQFYTRKPYSAEWTLYFDSECLKHYISQKADFAL